MTSRIKNSIKIKSILRDRRDLLILNFECIKDKKGVAPIMARKQITHVLTERSMSGGMEIPENENILKRYFDEYVKLSDLKKTQPIIMTSRA